MRVSTNRGWVIVVAVLLIAVAVGGWWLLANAKGKPSAVISYMRNLPYLRPTERLYQVSSRDPRSLNKDSGRFLYQENGSYVIMDVMGGGAIQRIWMNGDPFANIGNIQIYVDDNITPTLSMSVTQFFAGKTAPYLYPLVGDNTVSSGGFYSYVPFTFTQRIKVATTGLPKYYNIEYALSPDPITTPDLATTQQLWQSATATRVPFGADKPEGGDKWLRGSSNALAPEQPFARLKGRGVVTALKLRLSPPAARLAADLRLVIRRSNVVTADVDVPLAAFFGSGMGEQLVNGLPAGIDPTRHLFYAYWPLPYSEGLSISLVNTANQLASFDYEVEYNEAAYAAVDYAKLGYFRATWNSASPPRPKLDYPVADLLGAGLYVGTTLIISGPVYLQEGNERIHIDDSLAPQIVGTGTEDYFNGGWGFKNANFSLPTHGNPAGKFGGPQITAYRWLLTDPIPFGKQFVYGQGHGGLGRNYPYNNDPYSYSSIAYYYLRETPTLSQTDEITFGNGGNIAAHGGQVQGQVWQGTATGYYETTQDRISDAGRVITATGSLSFTVALDPKNNGALLRRRFDYSSGWLRGKVSVDGQAVGTWYSPGSNTYKSWRDEEFMLPARVTQGKSQVTLRIDAEADPHLPSGAAAWNEFHYWVYSVMP